MPDTVLDFIKPPTEYRAEENPDGTFNVYDVPIFGETEKEIGKRNVAFTRKWLDKAVKTARDRAGSTGYLAPLKVWHKEVFVQPMFAGKFLPVKVETMNLGEGEIDVVFAHYLSVVPEVYHQMAAGRLPYVSIESADYREGIIDACALLDTEAPHMPFPLFRVPHPDVSNETAFAACFSKGGEDGSAVVSLFSHGNGRAALTRYTKMADDDKTRDDDENVAMTDEQIKSLVENEAFQNAIGGIVAKAMKAANDDGEDDDKKVDAANDDEGPHDQDDDKSTKAEKDDDDDDKSAKAGKDDAVTLDPATQAKIDALEGRLDARDTDDKINAEVDATLGRLSRFNLGTGARERLVAMAKDRGLDALKTYEETIKTHATEAPPTGIDATALSASRTGDGKTVDALQPYVGTDDYAKAVQANKDYDDLRAMGRLQGVEREDHIKFTVQGIEAAHNVAT